MKLARALHTTAQLALEGETAKTAQGVLDISGKH